MVSAVIGMLLLSGCAGEIGPAQPRPLATPVDALTCADRFGTEGEEGPTAGTIPDGFVPVALHRCDPYSSREEADGSVWTGTLVQRLEGELGAFIEAVGAPSDPAWPGPCTADMAIAPDLWAEDAQGRFVRLSYPSTGCGKPKSEQIDLALSSLEITAETFTPLTLLESPDASASGCATRASVTVLAGFDLGEEHIATVPTDPENPDRGVVTVPVEPPSLPEAHDVESLLLCDYASEPSPPSGPQMIGDGGVFTGARELDRSAAVAVLAAVATAPSAETCSEVASRFVVAHPLVSSGPAVAFAVELDGCLRVVDPAFRALAAPPELLALLG